MPTPQSLSPHPHKQPPHEVGGETLGCCFHPLNPQGQAGDAVQEMPRMSAEAADPCKEETDVLRSCKPMQTPKNSNPPQKTRKKMKKTLLKTARAKQRINVSSSDMEMLHHINIRSPAARVTCAGVPPGPATPPTPIPKTCTDTL